jgi:hypothetical protein
MKMCSVDILVRRLIFGDSVPARNCKFEWAVGLALQSLAPRGSLADYLGHVTSALIMRPRCMTLHRSKKTHGDISVLKTN